jgi:acetyl-CoA acyltransferase 1
MSARRWRVRDDQLLGGIEGYVADARFVGTPPSVMGIGPAYAIPMVLKNTGLDVADVDLFEVCETRWGG